MKFRTLKVQNFIAIKQNRFRVYYSKMISLLNWEHLTSLYCSVSVATNCSLSCGCDVSASQPVCGSDGKHYFTPCHAGCMGRSLTEKVNTIS